MKLILFGASGTIGSRILAEAVARGHEVTAVTRNPGSFKSPAKSVTVVGGDVLDSQSVASLVPGHDAVLSAIGGSPEVIVGAGKSLLAGLEEAGVKRLLVVGGAATLEVAPGITLFSTPEFPEAWKGVAQAAADVLELMRKNETLDWTFLSPAALIAPGERTGKFRLGKDQLVVDANGESRISAEDFAVAFIDEVEKPAHIRQRFTLAY